MFFLNSATWYIVLETLCTDFAVITHLVPLYLAREYVKNIILKCTDFFKHPINETKGLLSSFSQLTRTAR